MATEFSGSNYSETDGSNNSASPNGMPEGMAPSGVNDSWRQSTGAAKRWYDRDHAGTWCTVGGTANAITATYTTPPLTLVQGEKFAFKATAANTAATTFTPNSGTISATNVYVIANGTPTALNGHEIANGQIVELEYDGTQFQLLNPAKDEGSWTPTFVGTGTAGTFTYTVQAGRYIRIGNLVTVWCNVQISAISVSPTTNLTIAGLPFTSSNISSLNQSVALGAVTGITHGASMTQFLALIPVNSTVIDIFETGSNQNTSFVAASNLGTTGLVELGGTYRIN